MALNERQQRFVLEYLVDFNGTQAAIRAGYSAKTADVHANRLLGHAGIQAEIAKARQKAAARVQVTVDDVLEGYRRIAFADMRRAVRWKTHAARLVEDPDSGEASIQDRHEVVLTDSDQLDEATAYAISEISTTSSGAIKIKFHPKTAALDSLAKYLGMLVDRHQHSGPNGGPIPVDITNLSDRQLEDLIARVSTPSPEV